MRCAPAGEDIMRFHIREKVMSFHGVYNIFDDSETFCYYLKQKMVSLTNQAGFYDAQDRELAHISRKLPSMHAVHYLEMANGETAEIGKKNLVQLHDNYEIEGFGWTIQGGVLGHDFQVLDGSGRVIAEAKRAWISIGDVVAVDILDETQKEKVLAVLLIILLIHRDRKRAMEAGDGNPGTAQ